MFFTKEQATTEIREKMRGGNGNVIIDHIATGGDLPANCRLTALITLEPGCSIGYHVHEKETEIFHIVSGVGVADDNGEKKPVKAGDSLFTGKGAGHAIENTGTEPLKFFAVIILA